MEADANNALFMGQGGTKGTHVVEITPAENLSLQGGTQPNELIHQDSIRDGRQGTLEVKENKWLINSQQKTIMNCLLYTGSSWKRNLTTHRMIMM